MYSTKNYFVSIFILLTSFFFVSSKNLCLTVNGDNNGMGKDQSFKIVIDPQNYQGRYKVIDYIPPNWVNGRKVFILTAGNYTIDLGAGISSSQIAFSVTNEGKISNVINSAAVSFHDTEMVFNNVDIAVWKRNYGGGYIISSFYPDQFRDSIKTFTLVPGLTYYLENGSFNNFSNFDFSIDQEGNVLTPRNSAQCGPLVFKLNYSQIRITPVNYKSTYIVAGYGFFQGEQTLTFIPDIAVTIVCNDLTDYFIPGNCNTNKTTMTIGGVTFNLTFVKSGE